MNNKEKKSRPWMKTGENRICKVCSKEFYVPKNRVERGGCIYCSTKCCDIDKVGKPMHPNTKAALSKITVWNKGLKASEDERVKRCVDAAHAAPKPEPWNKGVRNGKADWLRYSDMNLYRNIHKKVSKKFGTPMECETCGANDKRKYQWANIDGRYTLERSDWLRLCPKCHTKLDNPHKKMKL